MIYVMFKESSFYSAVYVYQCCLQLKRIFNFFSEKNPIVYYVLQQNLLGKIRRMDIRLINSLHTLTQSFGQWRGGNDTISSHRWCDVTCSGIKNDEENDDAHELYQHHHQSFSQLYCQ